MIKKIEKGDLLSFNPYNAQGTVWTNNLQHKTFIVLEVSPPLLYGYCRLSCLEDRVKGKEHIYSYTINYIREYFKRIG
jgi:hypothetical protein